MLESAAERGEHIQHNGLICVHYFTFKYIIECVLATLSPVKTMGICVVQNYLTHVPR